MGNQKRSGPVSAKKGNDGKFRFYFPAAVGILYAILAFLSPSATCDSLRTALDLLFRLLPILTMVVFFMGLMKYFVDPKMVSKYVGRGSGIKGWLIAVATGLLSHGPIYVWFSMLKELKEQGMTNGLVAVFLYNRAVKIPLLPVMIASFGLKVVVILLFYMFLASLVQGLLMDILVKDHF